MSDEKFKEVDKSQAAFDNADKGLLLYAHSQQVSEAEVDAMKAHYVTKEQTMSEAHFEPKAVENALLVLRRVFNAPWIQESDIQLCLREDAKTFKSTMAVGTPEALAEKVTSEYWRSMCITNITE